MPDVAFIKQHAFEAADRYAHVIRSAVTPDLSPISPKKLERSVPTSKEEALSHLLWLCEDVRRAAKAEDFSTCQAHMNFINGALWYMGKEYPA